MTRRRGRRHKKLLDDLKDRRGYCQLKEEALDHITWRNRFRRGFGPVVWQITDDDDDIYIYGKLSWKVKNFQTKLRSKFKDQDSQNGLKNKVASSTNVLNMTIWNWSHITSELNIHNYFIDMGNVNTNNAAITDICVGTIPHLQNNIPFKKILQSSSRI